jgi:lauroyl/myristoyl acyltransferase
VPGRLGRPHLAPDGAPRPDAPFGRGPFAAKVLARVIELAVWVGCRLPMALTERLAVVGGHLEWMVRASKRAVLAENLARAVGAAPADRVVRRLVRREMVNEAHRSADLLWALGRPAAFLASVEIDGLAHGQVAAATGRGVLLTGIHLGGWELATALPASVLPVPTTALVADDWLAWAIEGMRAGAGLRVAYRTAPVSRLVRLLRAGEALVVLGDDGSGPTPRGATIRFLDAEAELPAGIATLARVSQSVVVVFAVVREGPRRWRVIVDPPIDPPLRRARASADQALLQRLADRWSELIRAYPDQWAASFRVAWKPGSARAQSASAVANTRSASSATAPRFTPTIWRR